jgi:hypothetical protein
MRFAHFEPVLQEPKNRAKPLLTINDFTNGLLCLRVNVLPDKDFRDGFSPDNRVHQIGAGLVAPNAPTLKLWL